MTKLQKEMYAIEGVLKLLNSAHRLSVELASYPGVWEAIGVAIDRLLPHHAAVASRRWAELGVNSIEPEQGRVYDTKNRRWLWGNGEKDVVSPPTMKQPARGPQLGEKVYTREYIGRKWVFTEVDSWLKPVEYIRCRDKESEKLGGWRWLFMGSNPHTVRAYTGQGNPT